MNSALQKGPDGLLGALDLKTTGQNPILFGELLQGTLEAMEFYLLRNRFMSAQGGAWVALFTATGTFTVPQTEVWRIKEMAVQITRNVADIGLSLEVNCPLRRATSSASGSLFTALFGPTVAADLVQQRTLSLGVPLWLGPGDRITVVPGSTMTAAASNISLILDYDIMQSG